jgi:hypothetical protein
MNVLDLLLPWNLFFITAEFTKKAYERRLPATDVCPAGSLSMAMFGERQKEPEIISGSAYEKFRIYDTRRCAESTISAAASAYFP